jgi:hypothetical protein
LFHAPFCAASNALTKEDVLTAYKEKFGYLKSWRIKYRVTSRDLYEGAYKDSVELHEFYGKGKRRGKVRSSLDVDTGAIKFHHKKVYNGCTVKGFHSKHKEGDVRKTSATALLTWGSTTPLGYAGLHEARRGRWWQFPSGAQSCDMTVLMRASDIRFLAEPVTVNGHECYIVERGPPEEPRGQWWLGRDLGLALVRYESHTTSPSVGRFLRFQLEFDDFVEIAPGFFMPHALHLGSWDVVAEDGVEKVKKTLDRNYVVTSVELNPEIGDDEFELLFPPGTSVKDEIAWRIYIAPDGDRSMKSSLRTVWRRMLRGRTR